MTSVVQTVFHAVYVLIIPVAIVMAFLSAFLSFLEIEKYESGLVLAIYGSPVDVLLAGAAASPLLVIAYLAYWLVRFLSSSRR